jgi:hypothetical protein
MMANVKFSWKNVWTYMYFMFCMNIHVFYVLYEHTCILCFVWTYMYLCFVWTYMYFMFCMNIHVFYVLYEHICILCFVWTYMYFMFCMNIYVFYVLYSCDCLYVYSGNCQLWCHHFSVSQLSYNQFYHCQYQHNLDL